MKTTAYKPSQSLLRGLTFEAASCFGAPHIGAYYERDDVKTNKLEPDALCAVCGKRATNSHHEPPIGMGGQNRSFLLQTNKGIFVLKPALISLCGSGTTGCHGLRHDKKVSFRWVWDSPEYLKAWFEGDFFTGDNVPRLKPHSELLFAFGYWEIKTAKEKFEYRGSHV